MIGQTALRVGVTAATNHGSMRKTGPETVISGKKAGIKALPIGSPTNNEPITNALPRGLTPDQYRKLLPGAQDRKDKAGYHAQVREDVFRQNPLMYPSARVQIEHYDHIDKTWARKDEAHGRVVRHTKYGSSGNPNDRHRDPFNEPVTDIFLPFDGPYPAAQPPDGHYSKRYGRNPGRAQKDSWHLWVMECPIIMLY